MKFFAFVALCLWLCAAGVLAPAVAEGSRWQPAHRRNQDPSALRKVLRPKRLALLVGIGAYRSSHWPALRYASRDAKKMRDALSKQGRFDRITVLQGKGQTTRRGLLRAIEELRKLNTSPWDTVVVYISAHGTIAYPSGSSRSQRYVVTSDAGANIPQTALAVQALRKQLSRFVSRRKLLILATCYTGASGSKSRLAPGNKGRVVYQAARRSRTMLILSAASLHQPAFESKELKSDVYTHFFLRCLRRMSKAKSPVSASRIHTCAVKPTFRYVKKKFGQVQLPGLESRIDGLDAVFLLGKLRSGRASREKPEKRSVVQVFRRQLKRWRIRFFRRGQKGAVAALEQPGEMLLSLNPGRYRVVMEERQGLGRRAFAMDLSAGARKVLEPPRPGFLTFEAGAMNSPTASVPLQWAAALGARWWLFGLRLGYGTGQGAYPSTTFQQHQIELQLELTWTGAWGRFGLSAGGALGAGLVLQDIPQDSMRFGPMLQVGALLQPFVRLHSHLSLTLRLQTGLLLVPLAQDWVPRWGASALLGVRLQL